MEIPTIAPNATFSLFAATSKPKSSFNLKDICIKVKDFALNIFFTIIYFITCCKKDLRTTKVKPQVPPPVAPKCPTLDFMKKSHTGAKNKLEFEDAYKKPHYAWYTEVNGIDILNIQPKENYGKNKEDMHSKKLGLGFDKDGKITSVFWENKQDDFIGHNCPHTRKLFASLNTKCSPNGTPIQFVAKSIFTKDISRSKTMLDAINALNITEHKKANFINKDLASYTIFLKIEESDATNTTLVFEGHDLEGKELVISFQVENSSGNILKTKVNGKDYLNDDTVPEVEIWQLANHLHLYRNA